jgi:hypothetical protein
LPVVTNLISAETGLVNLVAQEVTAAQGGDLTPFVPVVEELGVLQQQLAALLSADSSQATDPTFQQDLSALVSNQGQITDLLNVVAGNGQSGSSSGSA